MASESEKNSTINSDGNLMSLKEWKALNQNVQYPPEYFHFCRLSDGVLNRLDRPDDDDSLDDESLGSGLAISIQLCEGVVRSIVDCIKNIKTGVKAKIKNCLNFSCLKQ